MKRRDGLARCRYRGFAGMQRWVGWRVVSNNLWVLITADPPQAQTPLKNSASNVKFRLIYFAPEISQPTVRAVSASDTTSSMKPHYSDALETQMFLELVAKVKIATALESGVLDLKCPCGMVILPPTPVLSNLKDRQRGLLKSRIERHLREKHGDPPNPPHGLFEQTIREVLKQSFAGN